MEQYTQTTAPEEEEIKVPKNIGVEEPLFVTKVNNGVQVGNGFAADAAKLSVDSIASRSELV